MCTEDVRWSGPALPGAVHGHHGVRGSVAALFRAFPNVRIEAMEPPYISAENGKALSPYRFVGTMEGDWEPASIAATGAVVDFVGIDEWVFRGELLAHYDTLDVARQLGLLPPIGSREDRILARLQHVRARFQRHGEECRWSVGTQVGWQ